MSVISQKCISLIILSCSFALAVPSYMYIGTYAVNGFSSHPGYGPIPSTTEADQFFNDAKQYVPFAYRSVRMTNDQIRPEDLSCPVGYDCNRKYNDFVFMASHGGTMTNAPSNYGLPYAQFIPVHFKNVGKVWNRWWWVYGCRSIEPDFFNPNLTSNGIKTPIVWNEMFQGLHALVGYTKDVYGTQTTYNEFWNGWVNSNKPFYLAVLDAHNSDVPVAVVTGLRPVTNNTIEVLAAKTWQQTTLTPGGVANFGAPNTSYLGRITKTTYWKWWFQN